MKASEIIASIDIGTTKIAAFVGRRNEDGKIEILGHGKAESLGVLRGVVANIKSTVESTIKAKEEAEKKSNVKISRVFVGIAGQHIKSRQHKGSLIRKNGNEEISQEDIDTLISNMYNLAMDAGEEIIDVIPQDFIIDDEQETQDPIGMLGNSLEANFHLITGKTAAGKNILKCIEQAGLFTEDIILEPLASAAAVLDKDEKEVGVALVDIGGGSTDLAIFKDHTIRHTAVIPFGGDVITNDIKTGCSIIKKNAESLKVKFGSALASENKEDEIVAIPGLRGREPKEISLKNLAHIIQARIEEIIRFVHQEIKNAGYDKNELGAGIVLTGGGAQMKHIRQLCEFMTGMYTRIGEPVEYLEEDSPEELKSPIYSTGIGLIIEGISRYEKQYPEESVSKDKQKIENQESENQESENQESEKEKTKNKKLITSLSFTNFMKKLLDDDID